MCLRRESNDAQPTDGFAPNRRPIVPGEVGSVVIAGQDDVQLPGEGRILPPRQKSTPANVYVGRLEDELANESGVRVLLIVNLEGAIDEKLRHAGQGRVSHDPIALCQYT